MESAREVCGSVKVKEMERAREWVAILLNDVWHRVVIDFGCVRVIICMVVWYCPNEGDGEERTICGRTWTGLGIE